MARSVWKGPYINKSIWKNLKKVITTNKKTNIELIPKNLAKSRVKEGITLKIYNRRSTIIPEYIGTKCEIHTGNKWIKLNITENKIGHFFGEFAPSKKIAQYKRKTKLKKK